MLGPALVRARVPLRNLRSVLCIYYNDLLKGSIWPGGGIFQQSGESLKANGGR